MTKHERMEQIISVLLETYDAGIFGYAFDLVYRAEKIEAMLADAIQPKTDNSSQSDPACTSDT